MKKNTLLLVCSFFLSFTALKAQHVLVNDVDINKLDIEYCELSISAKLLNPTKIKVYVDYGQKWSMKRQNIMTENKKVVAFNSNVHALNFMEHNGWNYVEQTVTTTSDGQTTYKYLMKKSE